MTYLPAFSPQGLAIGNGLTEPSIQFASYGDYALQNGLISQTVSRMKRYGSHATSCVVLSMC